MFGTHTHSGNKAIRAEVREEKGWQIRKNEFVELSSIGCLPPKLDEKKLAKKKNLQAKRNKKKFRPFDV